MEFRILGPLEAFEGNRRIELSPKLRDVLGILLCRRGCAVSNDGLRQALWGETQPATATKILQVYVHQIRRKLGDQSRIVHGSAGYTLDVRPGELDADHFEALVGEGRAHVAAGRLARGAERFREALGLWRGVAFEGQEDREFTRDTVARLSELRLHVQDDLLDVELALGRHSAVIGELRTIVLEHPFREHSRAQLMLALYRLGRHIEALEVYERGRELMIEELGLEYGPKLRELHRAILNHDSALDLHQSRSHRVVAEVPRDLAGFVGRAAELETLRQSLSGGTRPAIAVITGLGGVGKTTLAVQAAHSLSGSFPDGQLYANLRGSMSRSKPADPLAVLSRFLRALMGEDAPAPADVDEAAAWFRSQTAGRRILVVLDDAAGAAQIRMLLPGGTQAGVLVTSRRLLATLEGAVQVRLDPFDLQDAVTLLGDIVGAERVRREPEASAEIARLCDRLPLAIRIVGARLTVRRDWKLRDLAERLADRRQRLDELEHQELAVRAGLADSVTGLSAEARRLFSLLGAFDGSDITAESAAVLNGGNADAALGHLIEARLLETAHGRYRMHDLVRDYSRELADALRVSVRDTAVGRILHYYLAASRRVLLALDSAGTYRATLGQAMGPEPDRHDAPTFGGALDWIEAERDNLVAVTRQAAATHEHRGVAVGLGAALRQPLDSCGGLEDQLAVARLALKAAEDCGDPRAIASASNDLGFVCLRRGCLDEAVGYHERAFEIWRETGDPDIEFPIVNGFGIACNVSRRYTEGVKCFERCLAICRRDENRSAECLMLANLGCTYEKLGRFDDAMTVLREARELAQELNYSRGLAMATGYLAKVHLRSGWPHRAIPLFEEALTEIAKVGDRFTRAEFFWEVAEAQYELGQEDQSRSSRREAVLSLREADAISDEEERALLVSTNPHMPMALRALS